jgi:mitogen-activated protein kinase 7
MATDLHKVTYSAQPLGLRHVQYFLAQLLHALAFLHRAGVLHRDVKPANCLLGVNGALKLCDFGLARGLPAPGPSGGGGGGGGSGAPGRPGRGGVGPRIVGLYRPI